MRVLLVAAILSGCTVPQARKAQRASEITLGSSLGAMLATIGVAYAIPSHDDAILEFGAIFVPISLLSAAVYVACDSLAGKPPPATEPAHAKETAMELAKQAKHAARAGDCAQVQAIEPQVRELDSGVYLRFLHDEVIRPCRAPTRSD